MKKLLLIKKDILIIVGVLVLAIISFFVINNFKEDGSEVVVKINGEEVARYSLEIDGTYGLNGGTNILCIKNHEAYLLSATCPDKLCVKQGSISSVGETIVCLPYKLTIIVSGESDVEVIG